MREFRGYDFIAKRLAEQVAAQEVCILTVGRSKVGRVYVLPLSAWSVALWEAYGGTALDRMQRVTTRTSKRDGLSEGVLLGVLVDQVDAEWKPTPDACLVVTLEGRDAAVLVPANAYWRGKVEPDA